MVAPLAGAWIEIMKNEIIGAENITSLPSRERGLKLFSVSTSKKERWSLPSRERGLKCINPKRMIQNMSVAPLAGAWIEIAIADPLTNMRSVAPLAGAWIEIGSLVHPLWLLSRRSPRGSVD